MMAKFTMRVECTAYQFNPSEVEHLDAWEMEDLIEAELAVPDVVRSAGIIRGQLFVVLYVFEEEEGREVFCLDPGDWLVAYDRTTFETVKEAKFGQFATPVEKPESNE